MSGVALLVNSLGFFFSVLTYRTVSNNADEASTPRLSFSHLSLRDSSDRYMPNSPERNPITPTLDFSLENIGASTIYNLSVDVVLYSSHGELAQPTMITAPNMAPG